MNPVTSLRVVAGIPTGGQFAIRDRSENTVKLHRQSEWSDHLPSTGVVDPATAVLIAKRLAKQQSGRYLFNDDEQSDVAQTALLSVRSLTRFPGRFLCVDHAAISAAV